MWFLIFAAVSIGQAIAGKKYFNTLKANRKFTLFNITNNLT